MAQVFSGYYTNNVYHPLLKQQTLMKVVRDESNFTSYYLPVDQETVHTVLGYKFVTPHSERFEKTYWIPHWYEGKIMCMAEAMDLVCHEEVVHPPFSPKKSAVSAV